MSNKYVFPLCIQLTAPENPFIDKEFKETLKLLQDLGFYGVELNILDPDKVNPEDLADFLDGFGLRMTMFASGGFANKYDLSLSSSDENIRKKTVDKFLEILSFSLKIKTGIICGFIKGGPGLDYDLSMFQLKKSIEDIMNYGSLSLSNLYLEATNHYEATIINTIKEGVEFAESVDNGIKILPDTYHMNIEENSITAAMVQGHNMYNNFHISDNNRYFPGFGSINFREILFTLKSLNYSGTISVEGRIKKNLHYDILQSARYLSSISELVADDI